MGRDELLVWIFEARVWQPNSPGEKFVTETHYDADFARKHKLMATFHDIYGAADQDPLDLTPMGWKEMIENVIQIELVTK
ncbi:uncharacterized protein BXZ73DRAFT_100538 [Epithele typhae]|uniref:uncharacterized protein n=1 Tax=Epithele typhae TaxID=378194 RepID=UPI0020084B38|nr:uncharacterized protein BXZ73DRAFT_100538 [Epithele typhae]KAH9935150.1 hypothetical protein BXZ73DRAFT_100538 [Epithele typhae]